VRLLAIPLIALCVSSFGCAATAKGLKQNAGQIATGVAIAGLAAAANAAGAAPPERPVSDEAQEAGRRDRARRRIEAKIAADAELRAVEEREENGSYYPPP
jgi:hypothetical protein